MSQTLTAPAPIPLKTIAPRQLAALFAVNVIPPTIGGFVMPLLPVYTARLGIDPTFTGFYLAISFFMLALGSISSGFLSKRVAHRRRVFMVAAAIQIPCIMMLGQVSHVALLTLFTSITWFWGGATIGIILILAGESAQAHERGRVYGVLGMSGGLGTAIGGFTGGPIVESQGFPTMFAVAGAVVVVQILAALFVNDTKPAVTITSEVETTGVPTSVQVMTAALWFLFAANVMAHLASLSTGMSRPLGMDGLGFSEGAVSSTNAIAGLLIIPIPFLMGRLSDRVGRKPMLLLIYGLVFSGTVVLMNANLLWHFWIAAILNAMLPSSVSVGSALINDLVAKKALSTALSRYASLPWVGGTVGFAFTGIIIQATSLHTVYIITALVAATAGLLILPIRGDSR